MGLPSPVVVLESLQSAQVILAVAVNKRYKSRNCVKNLSPLEFMILVLISALHPSGNEVFIIWKL